MRRSDIGGHARLNASSASRWLNCPKSVKLSEGIRESSSACASEGTLAHSLGEVKLGYIFSLKTPEAFVKDRAVIKSNSLYADDMDKYTNDYTDYVREVYNDADAELPEDEHPTIEIEADLDYSNVVKDGHGKGDMVIASEHTLHIIDLKYGMGVPVSAIRNPQLMLYGVGGLNDYMDLYDIKRVVLHVFQPRIDNSSTYEISPAELLAWAHDYVAPRAKLAWDDEGVFADGDWCRFCKAKAHCPLLMDRFKTLMSQAELKDVTDEDILNVLNNGNSVKAFIKAVVDKATMRAETEGIVPEGYKLIQKSGRSKWLDLSVVSPVLTKAGLKPEEFTKVALLGQGEVKKLLKGKDVDFSTITVVPEGEKALVKVTAKGDDISNNSAKKLMAKNINQ